MNSATTYVRAMLGAREPVLQAVLEDAVGARRLRPMQVDDNAGRILQLLTSLRRPARAIEIGTYFGFSAIHIGRGLAPGGRLTTIESDRRMAEMATDNIARTGLADRVEVVVGDALEVLAATEPQTIGLIFIDGDKRSYPDFLKRSYPLLEPDGLLIADDAFAAGEFAPEAADAEQGRTEARAINTYNRAVLRSPNLFSAFVGTNNGLIVSVKR